MIRKGRGQVKQARPVLPKHGNGARSRPIRTSNGVKRQTPGFYRIVKAGDEPGSEFVFVRRSAGAN
jgi:hypothetical protein